MLHKEHCDESEYRYRGLHIFGESLFLPKDFFELPSRKKSAKITRPLMPSAPLFVRVTSFRPSMGSKRWLSHDLTPFRDALQVFSALLRKPARRYGYRGLKIFTSLALRFQDFQRMTTRKIRRTLNGMFFITIRSLATA